MQKLVEIRRFDNPVEAHVLLDLLTDAGIPARIFDEHVGSALPHYGMIGVRVVVRQDAVTGGDHGHLGAQLGEGGDELRTGDTGTDDDEVLGASSRS